MGLVWCVGEVGQSSLGVGHSSVGESDHGVWVNYDEVELRLDQEKVWANGTWSVVLGV